MCKKVCVIAFLFFCVESDLWCMQQARTIDIRTGATNECLQITVTEEDKKSINNLRSALCVITSQGLRAGAFRSSCEDFSRCGNVRDGVSASGPVAKNSSSEYDELARAVRESVGQVGYLQRRFYKIEKEAGADLVVPRTGSALCDVITLCREQLEKLNVLVRENSHSDRLEQHARGVAADVQELLRDFFGVCARRPHESSLRVLQGEYAQKRVAQPIAITEKGPQVAVSADSVLLLCADLVQRYCMQKKQEMLSCVSCSGCPEKSWCSMCQETRSNTAEHNRLFDAINRGFDVFQPEDSLAYLDLRIGLAGKKIDQQVKKRATQKKDDLSQKVSLERINKKEVSKEQEQLTDRASQSEQQGLSASSDSIVHEPLVNSLVYARRLLATKKDWACFLNELADGLDEAIPELLKATEGTTSWAESSVRTEQQGGIWWLPAVVFNKFALKPDQKERLAQTLALLPEGMNLASLVALVHNPVIKPLLKAGAHRPLIDSLRTVSGAIAQGESFCSDTESLLALSMRKRTLGKPFSVYLKTLGGEWFVCEYVDRPLSCDTDSDGRQTPGRGTRGYLSSGLVFACLSKYADRLASAISEDRKRGESEQKREPLKLISGKIS